MLKYMIYEVVVCTNGKRPNKAPIGIYLKDNKDNNVRLHLFFGSHTYDNLLKENYFSVNVVEPLKIAEAVITDEDNYKFFKNIPYIEGYYTIFYKVVRRKIITKKDDIGETKLMIIEGEKIHKIDFNKDIKPYCRADGLIVEMAILYSRNTY